jgi:hypothetical protein
MVDDAWGLHRMKIDEDEIIKTLKEKYKYELGNEIDSVRM